MARDPAGELPAALRAFLHGSIDAVEQVDILMVLRRTARHASAAQVAGELGLAESPARLHLEHLAGRGLLDARLGADDVLYRYDPVSADLQHAVDLLARYYGSARTAVVRFITAPGRRALRDFAEAFRLRGSE